MTAVTNWRWICPKIHLHTWLRATAGSNLKSREKNKKTYYFFFDLLYEFVFWYGAWEICFITHNIFVLWCMILFDKFVFMAHEWTTWYCLSEKFVLSMEHDIFWEIIYYTWYFLRNLLIWHMIFFEKFVLQCVIFLRNLFYGAWCYSLSEKFVYAWYFLSEKLCYGSVMVHNNFWNLFYGAWYFLRICFMAHDIFW